MWPSFFDVQETSLTIFWSSADEILIRPTSSAKSSYVCAIGLFSLWPTTNPLWMQSEFSIIQSIMLLNRAGERGHPWLSVKFRCFGVGCLDSRNCWLIGSFEYLDQFCRDTSSTLIFQSSVLIRELKATTKSMKAIITDNWDFLLCCKMRQRVRICSWQPRPGLKPACSDIINLSRASSKQLKMIMQNTFMACSISDIPR